MVKWLRFDIFADIESHQVFSDKQRTGIPLARGRDQIFGGRAAEEQEMVVHRQLGFNTSKNLTGLLRSGMIAADSFQLRGTLSGSAANRSDFVNHQVGAARMIDQVFIESRVS